MTWLPEALRDVQEIEERRSGFGTTTAERLSAAFFDRSLQIAEFPRSGRMIPEFNVEYLREVLEQGFRIMYEVFPDRIEVFSVIHSRQQLIPPDAMSNEQRAMSDE